MRLFRSVLVAALLSVVSSPLAAQHLGPQEDRPRLRDASDTNDASAYYQQGLELFAKDPDAAAAAFYWAARINPSWGDAIYARRAALIMRDRSLMARVFNGRRGDRHSGEMLRLDSLQFRALMANPFLYRRLDLTMFQAYVREAISRDARLRGEGTPGRNELDYEIDQYLRSGGPETRAWLAYAEGQFQRALDLYSLALGGSRSRSSVHLERGRIFGMRSQVDSAAAEFDLALAELRKEDQKDLVVFYDSKAQAEFSKATLFEGAGQTAAAREAYAQALQEDLAYYPAHVHLGLLSLGARDSATAINELALAAQIASDEPSVRYLNGYVLASTGHDAEAAAEFQKAIQLEPFYALPYLRLGQVSERIGKGPQAVAAYEGFLARASLQDMQRKYATERLAEVKDILQVVKP